MQQEKHYPMNGEFVSQLKEKEILFFLFWKGGQFGENLGAALCILQMYIQVLCPAVELLSEMFQTFSFFCTWPS